MSTSVPKLPQRAPRALPIAHPLDEFYLKMGMKLPPIEQVRGEEVPEPYKRLLVHNEDMTPTLEKFHGETIHLQVFRSEQRGDYYYREVALVLDKSEKLVEFGAIKINLALFSPPDRLQILQEHLPLGHILAEQGIAHSSRPKAFLRLRSDDFINQSLKLSGQHWLYGRRNTLFDSQQRPLAEIVEILPPTASTG
jgi:chorismate-pyruvate lyase